MSVSVCLCLSLFIYLLIYLLIYLFQIIPKATSWEESLSCPKTARTIFNSAPVLTKQYLRSPANSSKELENTSTKRTFLSVLTRAVDDSGWLEETEENPYTEKKLPILIEIIF